MNSLHAQWLLCLLPLLLSSAVNVHGTISVISEDTNETVRVIYEKNIRAVSDAVEGYIVIASPLNACDAVDPAPVRRRVSSSRSNGSSSTEESLYSLEDDGRPERDWVLLSIVYDCDVTTKARNAQLAGYKALIIQNIGSNDSQHIPWHILRFPLVKLNHVLVGEYDGDLLRFNFSYPNNRFYVKFEEDKFYQLMCYILIGVIIVLLSTMFALFWFQICCAIIIVVPQQVRVLLNRWLHPGKRRLTRPMLQQIPVRNWSRSDPFQACAICQEDFKENDKIRVLPCLHGFHSICVDPWLLRRSRRCPCCMQRVKLPTDENDEDEEEETYPSSRRNRDRRGSSDQERGGSGGCRGGTGDQEANDPVEDPLLLELAQSPQARFHSAMSNPKSEGSEGGCTITSPSESRKSSQEVKTLDWQLRRFLQNFNYTPNNSSSKAGDQVTTTSTTPPLPVTLLPCKAAAAAAPSSTQSMLPPHPPVPIKLLETNLDNSQSSCCTETHGGGEGGAPGSTLEVHVGTILLMSPPEDGEGGSSYHLSSPYPASSQNTSYTLSTTRDRKTSDATTISGSLPRDESSLQIAEEIIISPDDVFNAEPLTDDNDPDPSPPPPSEELEQDKSASV